MALALPLLASAMTLAACDIDIDLDDGPTVERSFALDTFDSITIEAPFEVTIRQGATQSVTVQVGEDRLDDLDIEVVDGELTIDLDGSFFGNGDLVASITTTDIEELRIGSASDVVLVDIETDDLRTDLSGASRLRTSGTIDHLDLRLSGASEAELDGTTIGSVSLTMSGASSAEFDGGAASIDGSISGASSLDAARSTTLGVETHGASNIDRN